MEIFFIFIFLFFTGIEFASGFIDFGGLSPIFVQLCRLNRIGTVFGACVLFRVGNGEVQTENVKPFSWMRSSRKCTYTVRGTQTPVVRGETAEG